MLLFFKVKIQLPLVESATQTDQELLDEFKYYSKLGFTSLNAYPASYENHYTSESQVESQTIDSMAPSISNGHNGIAKSILVDSKLNNQQRKSGLSCYLIALRPWSFTASITPVALGSVLAYKSLGVFNIGIFFTTMFTALCVHAAGNIVNTYFDFVRGVDNKKSDDRTLVDSILLPSDVVRLGAVLYVAGCVGFWILYILSPAKMEHLALVYFCGLSSSFLYTGGLGLKYIALGDILIVLTFGPLAVVFSHLSQTGQLSLIPLIYAVPLALNTEAILHSNNTRDMESDRMAGAITMAILLGKTGSYCLFCFLLFTPYFMFFTIGLHYSPWLLMPALSIFLVFKLEKSFRKGNLTDLPHQVAHLNLVMGLLYIAALYLADSGSLPSMTPLS